jgi:hypothetical protein
VFPSGFRYQNPICTSPLFATCPNNFFFCMWSPRYYWREIQIVKLLSVYFFTIPHIRIDNKPNGICDVTLPWPLSRNALALTEKSSDII